MTSLNRSRRRAEQFAALLDATSATGERASAADARLDRELAGLLELVTTLRDHPAVSGLEQLATPREAHTVQLRERLMTEAAGVLTPERAERHAVLALPQSNRGARERRLAAAATVLVVLGGTAGMASAAERALPGQALYPVKRGIEHVDVVLSTSTAGKGRDVLHQASTRLDEVKELAEGPVEGRVQIPGTMEAFAQQAHEGTDLMIQAYQETSDPSTLQTVQDFAANEGSQVEALAQSTTAVKPSYLDTATTALTEIQNRAAASCEVDCPVIDSGLVPVSADVPAPAMPAADGSDLGTGDLPPELGTVPPATGDGSTVDPAAPTDGSAAGGLGLTSDPASTSPLPPILGLPGLGGLLGDGSGGGDTSAGGTGAGTGSDSGSGSSTDGGTGTGSSSSPTAQPTQPSTPEPTSAPTTSAPVDTPTPSPTPTDPSTTADPSTPADTPTASASGGDGSGDGSGSGSDGTSSSSAGASDSGSDAQSASGDGAGATTP